MTELSRRTLLRGTAAAAAVAAATPLRADDRPVPKAPAKGPIDDGQPIRIGFIGLGGMGHGHLDSTLRQIAGGQVNAQVVAVAEVQKFRREDAQKKATDGQKGVEVSAHVDYLELLDRPDIDCVLIASPEHWHAQMAVDAIARGKDVYLEKPMTLRLPEALWLQKVMEANPHMRLQVGTQYMMWGRYREAKRLIAAGEIGKPLFSQTGYCRNSKSGEWLYGIDDRVQPGETLDWERWCGPLGGHDWDTNVFHRWRRYKTWSTGIVGDLLVHMVTPMIYALNVGWPTRVSAIGGHYIDKAMENHDQVNLTVQFEKEHTMVVAGSTCNEQGYEPMIRGHEANLYLGSNNCVLRPERIFAEDIDTKEIKCDPVNEQPALRLDWFNSVRTRAANISPVELGTQVMVVVDLATRAMWEGGEWLFDPATRTTRRA